MIDELLCVRIRIIHSNRIVVSNPSSLNCARNADIKISNVSHVFPHEHLLLVSGEDVVMREEEGMKRQKAEITLTERADIRT